MPAYDDGQFDPPAPVARATIRQPDRGEGVNDLRMLIDSGADVTLVPRFAAESLGVVGTGERYRLMGYDGTIRETDAVRIDLIFLGRRFRGRFLLTEDEIGVLGRDVLNHVRLLLDGPAAAWEERPSSGSQI